ncbi:MAG: hypothetical protein V4659_05805 [Pseudomonadota bacterium]
MRIPAAAALLLVLASCASPRPAPPPPVVVPPRPVVTPPPPVGSDWRDWPLTPGSWSYAQDARDSIARFGRAGFDAELTLRCERNLRQIQLARRAEPGASAATLTVRTSSLLRPLAAQPTGGTPSYVAVTLGANDALLDAMGFSRGRFVIEQAGRAPLVIPAWPEILRVTEDCRG